LLRYLLEGDLAGWLHAGSAWPESLRQLDNDSASRGGPRLSSGQRTSHWSEEGDTSGCDESTYIFYLGNVKRTNVTFLVQIGIRTSLPLTSTMAMPASYGIPGIIDPSLTSSHASVPYNAHNQWQFGAASTEAHIRPRSQTGSSQYGGYVRLLPGSLYSFLTERRLLTCQK
jgi:hypothetical protein